MGHHQKRAFSILVWWPLLFSFITLFFSAIVLMLGGDKNDVISAGVYTALITFLLVLFLSVALEGSYIISDALLAALAPNLATTFFVVVVAIVSNTGSLASFVAVSASCLFCCFLFVFVFGFLDMKDSLYTGKDLLFLSVVTEIGVVLAGLWGLSGGF